MRKAAPPSSDLLPPHDDEAEQCTLGSMLLDVEAADVAIDLLTAPDFYREANQTIFTAISDLRAKAEVPDLVTATFALRDAKQEDRVGGSAYLSALISRVPSAKNINRYAQELKRRSLERQLLLAGNNIMALAHEPEGVFGAKYSKALGMLYNLEAGADQGFRPLQPAMREHWEALCQVREGQAELVGLPTPFPKLNELSGGLRPGTMTVLGGDPGEGKTQFAIQIIEHLVKQMPEIGVAVFTLEMLDRQYAARLLTSLTKLDLRTLERRRDDPKAVSDEEWKWAFERSEELGRKRVWIDDSFPRFEQCRARLFRLIRRERIDLVVADYVQLIRSEAQFDREDQEIAMISVQFAELAKTLPCHVILISQLRRPMAMGKRPKPTLRDFKGSSGLEQAASLGLLLWRPDGGERADLILTKNRYGPAGEIELSWEADRGLFSGGLEFWKGEKDKEEQPDVFSPA